MIRWDYNGFCVFVLVLVAHNKPWNSLLLPQAPMRDANQGVIYTELDSLKLKGFSVACKNSKIQNFIQLSYKKSWVQPIPLFYLPKEPEH